MAEHRFRGSSTANSHQLQTTDSLSTSLSSLNPHDLWLITALMLRYLPVRTLFQLRHSSKYTKEICDCNDLQLGKERRKDEARDWYFALAYEDSGEGSRKWYGLHQWTKEQHTLPDLSFLTENFDYDLEAVSSGLLVLSKCTSPNDFVLIVCNPLSKKRRVLPRHTDCNDGQIMMSKPYEDAHIRTHLVLGDSLNAYKVIRLSMECINVYSSSTNSWVCSPYDQPFHNLREVCISWILSTVCFNGRVYILKENPIVDLSDFVVNLDQMEISFIDPISISGEVGRNKTCSLNIYDIESGEHVIKRDITFSNCHTVDSIETSKWRLVRNPILVECMGNLYAVAAACERGHNPPTPYERHETHVANCEFHIFKLTEEGRLVDHSCWEHVVVPVVQYGLEWEVKEFWEPCRNLHCVARSTVIYLEWSCKVNRLNRNLPSNLFEYDVVSGLHRTYTVGPQRGIPFYRGHAMTYIPTMDLEP